MEKIAEIIQLRPWCFRVEIHQPKGSYHALYKYRRDPDGENLFIAYTVKIPLRVVFEPQLCWTFLAWEVYSPLGRMSQEIKRLDSIDEAENYILPLMFGG